MHQFQAAEGKKITGFALELSFLSENKRESFILFHSNV